VLLVDDEPHVTLAIQQALRREPFEFECASSGKQALALLDRAHFDVVVSDERMPEMAGSDFLTLVREQHPDVARIILSGQASIEAAVRAINNAEIFRFLLKPCPPAELALVIREAVATRDRRRESAEWRTQVLADGRVLLGEQFDSALHLMWMGYQPVYNLADGWLHAFEALLRTDMEEMREPLRFIDAARELGRSVELCRAVRNRVASQVPKAAADLDVYVNVEPSALDDELLLRGGDPLAKHAKRIVIEITERESLHTIGDLEAKVAALRDIGYRIAVDDVGAGYAGLNSLALLVPDLVKFDMQMIRGIDVSPTKQKLVGSMVAMCRDLGISTIAEGLETRREFETVLELGCDFAQGFLFAPARREFEAAPFRV
jgi:EAL domain-containing protein (putative c-di-GMP-specific phosphodiesterase class I)